MQTSTLPSSMHQNLTVREGVVLIKQPTTDHTPIELMNNSNGLQFAILQWSKNQDCSAFRVLSSKAWFFSYHNVTLGCRLRVHIENPDANPLLIFPEGTCVNNEYTVMFKKVRFYLFRCIFLLQAVVSTSVLVGV